MTNPSPPPPMHPDQERALSMQMTVYSFAELWASNGCANLTALAKWPSVAKLAGAFEGIPAIILSPGPSLSKNVELVKPLKGKVLIIAYTRTLSALAKVGLVSGLRELFDDVVDPVSLGRDDVRGLSVSNPALDKPADRHCWHASFAPYAFVVTHRRSSRPEWGRLRPPLRLPLGRRPSTNARLPTGPRTVPRWPCRPGRRR